MPTIICSFCEYVGQGEDELDQFADALAHEEYCPERLADVMSTNIDEAYEENR